jgi:threonine/homoserine/homoserine lactone efflux protein
VLESTFLLKGFLVGLSIAAAIGPISLLCIQRTAANGFKFGMSVGFGAALADIVYSTIAGAGLVTLSSFMLDYENIISAVGSWFLLWLGIKTFKSQTKELNETHTEKKESLLRLLFSSFFLTLSSPMTIILFTAIFSGMGLLSLSGQEHAATSIVLGVFLGSMCWWVILSTSVDAFRDKLSPAMLTRINRASGIMLIGFAAFALIRAYFSIV